MSDINIRQTDRELIFDLAHKLTGTMEVQSTRHEIVITNVVRRMHHVNKMNLSDYLNLVSESEAELAHFISAVTIHTTAWFRELPHYKRFERILGLQPSKFAGRKLRVLSAACSTGEETYSFGLVLESFRRQYADFDYELVGFDVDPICVQRAEAGFYQINDPTQIPQIYRHLLIQSRAGVSNFIVDPDIRKRSFFHVGNLLEADSFIDDPFDFVFCRNVLIYFSEEKCNQIIANILGVVKSDGTITLGHSEAIDSRRFNLNALGESAYKRTDEAAILPTREKPITVMSIDNSSWVRLWLATALAEHGIKVITADTTEAANELLLRHKCDLITLDLSNHGQSGTNWLLQIRKKGIRTPVIVLTDASAEHAPAVLDALSGGSQDYVSRSQLGKNPTEFVDRIKSLVQSHRTRIDSESQPTTFSDFKSRPLKQLVRPDVILVGASTGGTDALCQLLTKMPKGCPPVVAVQHIPREFSKAFLDRVGRASGLIPSSPEKGKEILGDHVYLSISDAHIGVRQNGDRLSVYYSHGDKLAGHRPSVDYLFQTASFLRGKKVLACLLTGMGRDGAQGLLELKRNGALTLAQDESTSVVWGMPGEAMKLGAPMVLGSVRELREIIVQSIRAGKNSTPLKTG